jgi:uncharacterized protein (TIRG00374 family)
MSSGRIRYLFKVVVSIVLFAVIITRANMTELFDAVLSVNGTLFLISLAITGLRTLLSAYRWKMLLLSRNIDYPFWKLTHYYMVGSFYNLVFPSVLGGDVIRMLMLSKEIGSKSKSLSSIFVERFFGFFSLSVIALISLASGSYLIENRNVTVSIVLIFLFFIAAFFLVFHKPSVGRFLALLDKVRLAKVKTRFENFYDAFYSYKDSKRSLVYCFFISMLHQIVGIVVVYMLGLSIGMRLDIIYYFIFIPLIWIIIMIPVSISGFGIREGAFVYFFSLVGVSNESGLLLSVLFFSHSVIAGLVGGVLSLTSGLAGNRVCAEQT